MLPCFTLFHSPSYRTNVVRKNLREALFNKYPGKMLNGTHSMEALTEVLPEWMASANAVTSLSTLAGKKCQKVLLKQK